jgi:sortase (surface protein transpeptidase)
MARGDRIYVRTGRTTITYRVTSVRTLAKAHVGAASLTAPRRGPWQRTLRLITCGGAFDADRRSYNENVIVDAVALRSSTRR